MRFFKKAGNVKYKRTEDEKQAEGWLKTGWEECDNHGVLVPSAKSKKNKGEKVDV